MSDDVLALAAQEGENKVITDEKLSKISKLALLQAARAEEIKRLDELLKEKKKELARIEENDLPEAMDEIGMKKFELKDGTKIDITTFYSASIPAERKDEAYDWLSEKGHDGIIKTEVEVKFSKGEIEIARQFLEFARGFNGAHIEPELSQTVHHSTLKAFVKEQVESGAGLPLDLFGVFIGRKAKITRK